MTSLRMASWSLVKTGGVDSGCMSKAKSSRGSTDRKMLFLFSEWVELNAMKIKKSVSEGEVFQVKGSTERGRTEKKEQTGSEWMGLQHIPQPTTHHVMVFFFFTRAPVLFSRREPGRDFAYITIQRLLRMLFFFHVSMSYPACLFSRHAIVFVVNRHARIFRGLLRDHFSFSRRHLIPRSKRDCD